MSLYILRHGGEKSQLLVPEPNCCGGGNRSCEKAKRSLVLNSLEECRRVNSYSREHGKNHQLLSEQVPNPRLKISRAYITC
jgi:hypothetical protein